MEVDRLIRQKGHTVDIYERSQVRGYRGSNKFIFTQLNHPLEEIGDYCTVEETVPGVWRVKIRCSGVWKYGASKFSGYSDGIEM